MKNNLSVEELHAYFYKKHQVYWNEMIEDVESHNFSTCNYYIRGLKEEVKAKLFPHIVLYINCFGCHLAPKKKTQYGIHVVCNKCFLNFDPLCNEKDSLWRKLRHAKCKDEFISLCKQIRDCGYHITVSKTRMMKLYKEMNQ